MDFLRTWITNIAVIIIFVMFMEIMLPNNSMKRFINVVVGLLIILVVVKPFLALNNEEQFFNYKVIETSNILDGNYMDKKSADLGRLQKQEALKLFEENLKNKIKALLASQNGIKEENINIDINMNKEYDSKDFGKINELAVSISDSRVKAIEVDKISVGVSNGKENNKNVIKGDNAEYKLNNDKLAGEVKFTLSKALGLDEKCISVYVQE